MIGNIMLNTTTQEAEVRDILQYWLDIANTKGYNGDGTSFDYEAINDALDALEVMLLIYNVFAVTQLELVDEGDTGVYKLEVI